jgi:hypothetical protein
MLLGPATGCYYYHEPAFKGTILDIDTKQPLEGAVVVAEYTKASLGLVESPSSIIDVRETLTDKEGHFCIPPYTAFIQPFSWQIPNSIIIFKPGYASLKLRTEYFIGEALKEEQEGSWLWTKEMRYKLRGAGIVELPRIRTMEERRQAWMDADIFGPEFKFGEKIPLLYIMVSEESKNWP